MLPVRFYYGSGSPYAWRVWLALEHKGIPYHRKPVVRRGRLKTPEFGAQSERRVPVWSTTILRSPNPRRSSNISRTAGHRPGLFARDRASARSSGAWCTKPISISRSRQRLASGEARKTLNDLRRSCLWEAPRPATIWLANSRRSISRSIRSWRSCCGSPAAERISSRTMHRTASCRLDRSHAALPIVQRTWPPHWK